MIITYGAGFRISCDEMIPCVERHAIRSLAHAHACGATIDITPLTAGGRLDGVIDAARNSGWRAYLLAHRRDLCPTHAAAARRRLTLVLALKG